MIENSEIPSPTITAPNSSEVNSEFSSSPIREESKELSYPHLLLALLKLKKCHSYSEAPTDIKLEQSIDGTCKIYLRNSNYNRDNSAEPTSSPAINEPQDITPAALEQIINRLMIVAETRNSESNSTPSTPTQRFISLDNCSIVYFPENSEFQETQEQYEVLPSSKENQTPSHEPYYNLKSPQTLRFIQRALLNRKSRSSIPKTPDDIVQESLDRSFIIIHPKEIEENNRPSLFRHGSAHNFRVTSISQRGTEDLSLPEAVQNLKRRLEELSIDDCSQQAIDNENIRIITLEYSPTCLSPGSRSSVEQSTPILKATEHLDLLSPETNFKLIRKLHAVQEDMEGEDEAYREIEGSTVLFLNSDMMQHTNVSSQNNSIMSPIYQTRIDPSLNAVAERLRNLRSGSETPEEQ